VGADYAETRSRNRSDPGFQADIFESPVAKVVKEPRGDGQMRVRAAVIALAGWAVALLVALDRVVHIVRHEEIEISIAVVVDEGCARAPARVVDASNPR